MAALFPPEDLDTQEKIDYLAQIKTTARRIFVGNLFKDQDRRKNKGTPPDGIERRLSEFDLSLKRILERNEKVDKQKAEREEGVKRGVLQILGAFGWTKK